LYAPKAGIAVGNKDDLLLPGTGEGNRIGFGKSQGGGNIGTGVQGVHEEHPANDGFHIPHPLHPAGNFDPGLIGKRYQMKSIPGPEKFPDKGAGEIVADFVVGLAHTGGGIQKQHQVHGALGGN
jgi:hypothetical protein